MINRQIVSKILEALTYFPAVAIIGPRQVGKTTLARFLEEKLGKTTLFLDLERTSDRQKLEEPELFLSRHMDKCVIIDEIQGLPQLFPVLRWLIDQNRVPARFILTGSATPELIRHNTETLAGRIAYFELTPFSLAEVADKYSLNQHWFRGGFPDALLAPTNSLSEMWINNFLETYLHRDIRRVGFEITIPAMERLLKVLSSQNGNLLNINTLSASADLNQQTLHKYLDILEGSFLIRRLEAKPIENLRSLKSPKIFLRDSGILHHLLQINSLDQLQGNVGLAASWEAYVLEQIARAAGNTWRFSYLKTKETVEIPILLETQTGKTVAIFPKYSSDPTPSKGFIQLVEKIKPDFQYVILPQGDTWERSGNLQISGLGHFLLNQMPHLSA